MNQHEMLHYCSTKRPIDGKKKKVSEARISVSAYYVRKIGLKYNNVLRPQPEAHLKKNEKNTILKICKIVSPTFWFPILNKNDKFQNKKVPTSVYAVYCDDL